MENEEEVEVETAEVLVPEDYYTNMQTAQNFNSFSISIIMGLIIVLLFFKGMK